MENIKTKVVHSKSKDAWNVIGTELGKKHKIAVVPYMVSETLQIVNERNKKEALQHAQFISDCFNKKQIKVIKRSDIIDEEALNFGNELSSSICKALEQIKNFNKEVDQTKNKLETVIELKKLYNSI